MALTIGFSYTRSWSMTVLGAVAIAAMLAPVPAVADTHRPAIRQAAIIEAGDGTIAIADAMARAQERFEGTVIEATLDAGKKHEKTDVVFELRMLTPRGDILKIRIDARDGTILEADGRGLVDARRRP